MFLIVIKFDLRHTLAEDVSSVGCYDADIMPTAERLRLKHK
jgi:hypothetical protein